MKALLTVKGKEGILETEYIDNGLPEGKWEESYPLPVLVYIKNRDRDYELADITSIECRRLEKNESRWATVDSVENDEKIKHLIEQQRRALWGKTWLAAYKIHGEHLDYDASYSRRVADKFLREFDERFKEKE